MSWLILLIAGIFEVGWATGLKFVDGVSRPWVLFSTVVALILSMFLLSLAMKDIPFSTAYAIWTGIGALGTFTVAVICFSEPLSAPRAISVLLIVAGLVGLKLAS